jgi:large subunit ribosomal protein L22
MEIIAKSQRVRISPRKIRLVVDALKGKNLAQVLVDLKFIQKRASKPLLKVINSAVANAKHNFGIEAPNLVLKKIEVGEGATYKRFRAVARGRAHHILKRTANIKVVLEDKKQEAKPKKAPKPKVQTQTVQPAIEQEHKEELKEFPFKEEDMKFETKIKEKKPISRRPILTRRIPQGKGK